MATNKIEFVINAKDEASRALDKAGKSITDLAKTAAVATTAIAGASTAVVAFTSSMASMVRETELMSDVAGLAVSEFTEMAHAANTVGISNEQLSDQLKDVNDKVGDFLSTGAGPMVDFFEQIAPKVGVTAEQFKNLSSKDALQLYVDSLEKANVSQSEMTFFMEAIANDATKLIPLFSDQGKAMRDAANDAAFLGITMSEELVKKSENLTKAMDRSGKAIKGLGLSISEELMPFITPVANAFANMVARFRVHATNLLRNTINVFSGVRQVLNDFTINLIEFATGGEAFQIFVQGFVNMGKGVGAAMVETGRMITEILAASFQGAQDIIESFAVWAFNRIRSIFTDNPAEGFSETVGATVAETMENIKTISTEGWESIKSNALEGGEAITTVFDGFKMSVEDSYSSGIEKAEEMRDVYIENSEAMAETNANITESNIGLMETLQGSWMTFYDSLGQRNAQLGDQLTGLMKHTTDGFSKAFANAIVHGESLSKALKNLTKQVAADMIAMFIRLGIQHLIQTKLAATAEGSKNASAAYGAAFASIAAIPIVGPGLAPGAAAAAAATSIAGMASAGAAGAASGAAGIAHGGLTNVPSEQTYLLDKGERVLSPNQNSDLTAFLNQNDNNFGGAGSIFVENLTVEVLPNATSADALLALDPNEMKEVVAGPIIDALNSLDDEGVRPNFIERQAF